MFKRLLALVTIFFVFAASAHAGDYKLEFVASDFAPASGVPGFVPQSVVSGSFIFSADSMNGQWTSIEAVDLTISGHAYSTSDVVFLDHPTSITIGGLPKGAPVLSGGTNDFSLTLSMNGDISSMSYAAPAMAGFWISTNVVSSISAVPEPASYAMLMAGLGLAGFMARRRRGV